MGCTSLEEEMNMILKVKNMQVFLERKVAWTKKEWNFWVHNREYQEFHRAVRGSHEIFIHLFGTAALPLAVDRANMPVEK
jgi:hypothetical protein